MSGGIDETGEDREIRELATRGTALGSRIGGLQSAAAAARGRLDDALLDDVLATADRAAGRLRLSARHTVVAVAGATGSGKSTTFNALVGLELSSIGVRRPTTSWATAVVWGSEGAGELLEWLGIPPRHQTMRDSMLDTGSEGNGLDGVVLMDLPDHDSTEVAHHLEVDRLVELADLLVWVVDPQKYADAALHDRYLKKLSGHQGVMLVVLNHIDTIAEEKREAMIADVRRLLDADGLTGITLLPVSAREGIGMDALRAELAARVASKRATTARVEADIAAAAGRLAQTAGTVAPKPITASAVEKSVADAIGIPAMVEAVERNVGDRARRAVAWPPLALAGRRAGSETMTGLQPSARSSVPEVAPVPHGVVRTVVRDVADNATQGMAAVWANAVRGSVTADLDATGEKLDRRLRAVDLGVDRLPATLRIARVVQWLLLLVAIAGGVWWALSAAGVAADAPAIAGLPLPALLLGAGLVLGIALALVGRSLVAGTAARSATDADERLRGAVRDVLGTEVIAPLEGTLRSYDDFRAGVAKALA